MSQKYVSPKAPPLSQHEVFMTASLLCVLTGVSPMGFALGGRSSTWSGESEAVEIGSFAMIRKRLSLRLSLPPLDLDFSLYIYLSISLPPNSLSSMYLSICISLHISIQISLSLPPIYLPPSGQTVSHGAVCSVAVISHLASLSPGTRHRFISPTPPKTLAFTGRHRSQRQRWTQQPHAIPLL